MNHCCYCFGSPWKVKAKYIVLCLNAFAKLQSTTRAFRAPVFMRNCSICSHLPWPYQSIECYVISPLQVMCRAPDSVATRKVLLEKKFDMKYMQVNVLINIASMTKIVGDIRTDQIDRQCPDALGM